MKLKNILQEEKEQLIEEAKFGKENSNWKGSFKNLTERGKHVRVTAIKGPASKHKCSRCSSQASEWASTKKDPSGPSDYIAVCKSCHSKMDHKDGNINKKNADKRPLTYYEPHNKGGRRN